MSVLIGLALGLPLLLLALLAVPGRARELASALAPWSALPALIAAAVSPPDAGLSVPWLLLGSRFGMDETGRVFLLLTAALWLLAGIYARAYVQRARTRYFAYHLLTLSGNLGVVLAHDVAGFYLAFLLMTLAAFGLIVHSGSAAARRAGLVYLVMAVAAEGALLAGFLTAASTVPGVALPSLAGRQIPSHASLLLLLGFGVKAGLPLLHMWLPLAHPEAPTPASAVLSGAMIKAGLLGWLRFLPVGEAQEAGLGALMVGSGLAAAFLGALAGVSQRRPKALLAYSSVSQMGFMTVAVGSALIVPDAGPALVTAAALFAFHHALAKGALFLGVGIAERPGRLRPLLLIGMALAAASLTGLPFTGGALAKSLLKDAVHPLAELTPESELLSRLLTLAAAGTGLLMLRLLALLRDEGAPAGGRRLGSPPGMWLPWLAALLGVAVGPALLAGAYGLSLHGYEDVGLTGESGAKSWELLWPALLAGVLYLLLLLARVPQVPPGDVLLPLERAALRSAALLIRLGSEGEAGLRRLRRAWNAQRQRLGSGEWLPRLEANLMRWDSAGVLLLILGALLIASLRGSIGG
jgi:hydrogenase-4 component B